METETKLVSIFADFKMATKNNVDNVLKFVPIVMTAIACIAFFFDLQTRLDMFQVKLSYTNAAVEVISNKLDRMHNFYLVTHDKPGAPHA